MTRTAIAVMFGLLAYDAMQIVLNIAAIFLLAVMG